MTGLSNASFDRCSFNGNEGDFKFCVLTNCRFDNLNEFSFKFCELRKLTGTNDCLDLYLSTVDDRQIECIEFDEN